MQYGVNAWVWSAPVTTRVLAELAPNVSQMGFDMIEVPLENIGDVACETGAQIICDELLLMRYLM